MKDPIVVKETRVSEEWKSFWEEMFDTRGQKVSEQKESEATLEIEIN